MGKSGEYILFSGQKQKPRKNIKITFYGMATIDYFERKLDDKNRLSLPVEIRAEFDEGFVVTPGFKKYLHLYPRRTWLSEVEPALQGSILDEQVADINVQFRMGKIEGQIDTKQGRIVLEKHLLDYAGIKKDLIAVRAGKYWRIMSKTYP